MQGAARSCPSATARSRRTWSSARSWRSTSTTTCSTRRAASIRASCKTIARLGGDWYCRTTRPVRDEAARQLDSPGVDLRTHGWTHFAWTPPARSPRPRATSRRFMRRHGIADLRRADPPIDDRHRMVLGRGRRRPADRVLPAVRAVLDDSSAASPGALVRRRDASTWPTTASTGTPASERRDRTRDHLGGRGRRRSRTLTYGELARETNRLANALKRLGVGQGDRVGLFLPMLPEAVVAFLACAKIGAIAIPIFSGFGAAGRRRAARTTARPSCSITADAFSRRRGSRSP